MIVVTKTWRSNQETYQEEIKRYKTNDIRKIVRKYKYEWDFPIEIPVFNQKAIMLKPKINDAISTRLFIEFIPTI